MRLSRMLPILLLLACAAAAFADPVNMTGTWKLNLQKSKWAQKPAPMREELKIEHNEPKLKYTGTVVDTGENETTYVFDGAIDGKDYPVKVGQGEQRATFKRLSPTTISSTLKTTDGKSEESTTTAISMDGKTLIRKVTLKAPDGKRSWTEVYDKQ